MIFFLHFSTFKTILILQLTFLNLITEKNPKFVAYDQAIVRVPQFDKHWCGGIIYVRYMHKTGP